MSIWANAAAASNAAQLAIFGEAMLYAKPGGVPVTFIGERRTRDPLEVDAMANYERIWTTRGELPFEAAAGDQVTIGTTRYTVHTCKPDDDGDSDGVRIYLEKC
jgi:hypothetical protein